MALVKQKLKNNHENMTMKQHTLLVISLALLIFLKNKTNNFALLLFCPLLTQHPPPHAIHHSLTFGLKQCS